MENFIKKTEACFICLGLVLVIHIITLIILSLNEVRPYLTIVSMIIINVTFTSGELALLLIYGCILDHDAHTLETSSASSPSVVIIRYENEQFSAIAA